MQPVISEKFTGTCTAHKLESRRSVHAYAGGISRSAVPASLCTAYVSIHVPIHTPTRPINYWQLVVCLFSFLGEADTPDFAVSCIRIVISYFVFQKKVTQVRGIRIMRSSPHACDACAEVYAFELVAQSAVVCVPSFLSRLLALFPRI